MAWIERYTVPFKSTPYEFHLHGISDLQIGSSSTSVSKIKERVREIVADPIDSGIIIPGDIEDEDRPSTRAIRRSAFSDREEVISRDAKKHMRFIDDEIIPILLPLQKTKYGIMGVLAGHHWTQLSPALNSVEYICNRLTGISKKKVNYLGQMMSYMDMTFQMPGKSIRKLIHVQHGEGGGQTKASSINKLDRTAQGFDGHVFIRAHDCQIITSKTDRLYPKLDRGGGREPELLHHTTVLLNLGAATRGYEIGKGSPSYIEQKMLRPVTLGWGTVKFRFKKALASEDKDHNVKCDIRVEI